WRQRRPPAAVRPSTSPAARGRRGTPRVMPAASDAGQCEEQSKTPLAEEGSCTSTCAPPSKEQIVPPRPSSPPTCSTRARSRGTRRRSRAVTPRAAAGRSAANTNAREAQNAKSSSSSQETSTSHETTSKSTTSTSTRAKRTNTEILDEFGVRKR
ncbi:unnamed protein product, partial [Amoebophrya sp. A25]